MKNNFRILTNLYIKLVIIIIIIIISQTHANWVTRVYGADGAVRQYPHRTHDLRSSSEDHHPSKNSAQKTICSNLTSSAPDDGRMYPKYVELRIHQ